MDIRKWLDETILPEQPPSPPGYTGTDLLPTAAPPLALRESDIRHKERSRRKHSTSNSSLIQPFHPPKQRPIVEEDADFDGSAGESVCTGDSHPADQCSGTSVSSEPYARRPRRKTRPERYEPKDRRIKERGTQVYRHRSGESRKTKSRSKRKKSDIPGASLVQSFQAKNVSKDRITLKPREKLGLFNKGKASSPVKGRGLPDLVFSEMKFLQRHRDQPDPVPQPEALKKKRKKDHAHAKGEEISAYFTSVRPALAEQDVNIQAKEGSFQRPNKRRDTDHGGDGSPPLDNAIPTVELPANAASSLGLGAGRSKHGTESYISWSESIRAPSATPLRAGARSAMSSGQLDLVHDKQDMMKDGGGNMLHLPAAPLSISTHLLRDSGERGGPSSITSTNHCEPPSHSYQHRSSSQRPANTHRPTTEDQHIESCAPLSSLPAFLPTRATGFYQNACCMHGHSAIHPRNIPPIGHDEREVQYRSRRKKELTRRKHEDETGVNFESSPGVDILEQESNSTLGRRGKHHATATAICDNTETSLCRPIETESIRFMFNDMSVPTIRTLPTVRFSGTEDYRSPVPSHYGPSIYEEQERHKTAYQQPDVYQNRPILESCMQTDEYLEEGDDEVDMDELDLAGIQEDTMTRDLHGLWDEVHEDGFEREVGARPGSGYGGVQETMGIGSSFWRPNRLY